MAKPEEHLRWKTALLFFLGLVAQTVWEKAVEVVANMASGIGWSAWDYLKATGVLVWIVAVAFLSWAIFSDWRKSRNKATSADRATTGPSIHTLKQQPAMLVGQQWTYEQTKEVLLLLDKTRPGNTQGSTELAEALVRVPRSPGLDAEQSADQERSNQRHSTYVEGISGCYLSLNDSS
jgi:hypothetical protein